MSNLYAIVCGENHMTKMELQRELPAANITPILVMRQGGETIVPVFESLKVAFQFARRNLPPDWVYESGRGGRHMKCGHLLITPEIAERIDAQQFPCIVYQFPRLVRDLVEFATEILEFNEVMVTCARRNKSSSLQPACGGL